MDVWLQVIVEWINCLDILENPVKDLQELQDGKFFGTLINLLSPNSHEDIPVEQGSVFRFIQAEYPNFVNKTMDGNLEANLEEIDVASLLLSRVSQEPDFQLIMCNKLRHDTQVKIKIFLEKILCYGKGITKERIRAVIAELDEVLPLSPKLRPLENFFDSPIVRSTHKQCHGLTCKRNRDLKRLQSKLEMAMFENFDLREDLKIQNDKVQNLHKQLGEKSEEMKKLRDERMRQTIPQSCAEEKDQRVMEDRYKKEIQQLENYLSQLHTENDKLQDERDSLSKDLTFAKRQCTELKEKLEYSERNLEIMSIQAELKNGELLGLKSHNDELRIHLQEIRKSSIGEQSFEVENVLTALSPLRSLNTSEVLSSVIDIQLQEAREESYNLKTQLKNTSEKLESIDQECKAINKLNVILEEKVRSLSCVEQKLGETEDKLASSCKKVAGLEEEKVRLFEECENVKGTLLLKESLLLETTRDRDVLKFDLDKLKHKLTDMENSVNVESAKVTSLELEVSRTKLQMKESAKNVDKLTEENRQYESIVESCKSILRDCIVQNARLISDTNVSFENFTIVELSKQLKISMDTLERTHDSNESDIKDLKANVEDLNHTTVQLRADLSNLEEKDRQNVSKQTNMSETIREAKLKIHSLEEVASEYLEEIKILREVAIQKEALTKDLSELQEELSKKNLLVESLKMRVKTLEDRRNSLMTDFDLAKVTFERQLNEHRKESDEIVQKVSEERSNMKCRLESLESENELLNRTIARNEEELNTIRTERDCLELKLSECNEANRNLNTRLAMLLHDWEQFICNVKMLEEEQHRVTTDKIDETDETLKVKVEAADVASPDLQSVRDECNSSQQQVTDLSERFKFQNELDEAASIAREELLKVEKECRNLNESQLVVDREMKMKDQLLNVQKFLKELYVKEKLNEMSLDKLQSKMKQLTEERSVSELKTKENIANLEEEASETRARAVHERNVLVEQLENEKSQRLDLEVRCKNLEKCNECRVKVIKELEECVKLERKELDGIRERCQTVESERLEIVRAFEGFELSMDNLKAAVTETCPDFKVRYEDPTDDNSVDVASENTSSVLLSHPALEREINVARECILHLYNANVTLERQTSRSIAKMEEDNLNFANKIKDLEETRVKDSEYYWSLVRNKLSLRASLSEAITSRNQLDEKLIALRQDFTQVSGKFKSILAGDASVSDELKHLRAKSKELEDAISDLSRRHLQNLQPLFDIMWRVFSWTEIKLRDTDYLACRTKEDEMILEGTSSDMTDLSSEKSAVDLEVERNYAKSNDDVTSIQKSIESFSCIASSYEANFKTGQIKHEPSAGEKLRKQIDQLSNEKKAQKETLDAVRARNVKLEKSMDELRREVKRLEMEKSATTDQLRLEEENKRLREERDALDKRPSDEDFENRLKEVHNEYGLKLEKIKQKLKTAYNEQVAKLNQEQERTIREKVDSLRLKMEQQQYCERAEREQQCRAHAEEIDTYKKHVSDLTSQLWGLGDRLLIEKQQHRDALQHLDDIKGKLSQQQTVSLSQNKTSSLDRRDFRVTDRRKDVARQGVSSVDVITEEITTYARHHNVKNIQAMGDAFKTEDEEGEVFDNIYLADMKEGQCSAASHLDRLSVLQMRNSLCKPHLKSSYPVEMQLHPSVVSEEDIKSGVAVEEVFNDSLSQSLLPGQKSKKRDRSQTSYKRPGPPTPSKNGGRLSFQGNELKSPNSRILKERNTDRRTTSTPRRFKDMFSSSFSKRQDENVAGTPRGHRLSSFFRKQRCS